MPRDRMLSPLVRGPATAGEVDFAQSPERLREHSPAERDCRFNAGPGGGGVHGKGMNSENQTSAAAMPTTPHGVPLALIPEARFNAPHRSYQEAAGVLQGVSSSAAPHLTDPAWFAEAEPALPAEEFLRALRHEMRRADRSGAALSLVVYRVNPNDTLAHNTTRNLLDALCRGKRETDLVGLAGVGMVAVICPETDAAGAQRFIEKMAAQGLPAGVAATAASYPQSVFEELAAAVREAAPAGQTLHIPFETDESNGYPLKRLLDIMGASVALILLTPLMLVVACAIAATSPGPVIFRQVRLGKGGVPFVFFKFRSMHTNSDDRIHRQYVADLIKGEAGSTNDGGAKIYKIRSDPRIFAVGKVIRKTSIDELPQLFNVLRGDMSMVGPRPALPYEVENYQSWHLRRILAIRPGITGLWQVEGRSRVPFDEMVRMDLRYIRDCSLWLDLSLMLRTFKAVMRCDGAE
jgi:lipopolysaccharide/colanic/teichoic acid biosynthesis glycosyltransferase